MTGLELAPDARRDSNPQYPDPRSDALSIMRRAALPIELHGRWEIPGRRVYYSHNVATCAANQKLPLTQMSLQGIALLCTFAQLQICFFCVSDRGLGLVSVI